MTDDNPTDETITLPIKAVRLVLELAVVIAIGGTSGFAGYNITRSIDPNSVVSLREEIRENPELRADPFTGAEGRMMAAKIADHENRLNSIERRVDKLPPRELELQMDRHTAQIKHIMDLLSKIITQVNDHDKDSDLYKRLIEKHEYQLNRGE